jgi:hypothetical protein
MLSMKAGQTENALFKDSTSPLFVPTLKLNEMDLPPPDLIKMDIEGGETRALRGARPLLDRAGPVVSWT